MSAFESKRSLDHGQSRPSRPSQETLDHACKLLELDASERDLFALSVCEIAAQYDVDVLAANCMGPIKEQKQIIKQAIAAMGRTLDLLGRITSDYGSALEMLSVEGMPDGPPIDLLATRNDLHRVRKAAEVFLFRYKPASGPAPCRPLESAVESLLALIEITLHRPIKLYADKVAGTPPEPRSPGGQALVTIIGAIQPRTTAGGLLYVIEKVRSAQPSTSPYLAILDACDPLPG